MTAQPAVTLEEAHGREARHHRRAEKSRRLPAREVLHAAHQFRYVPPPQGVGDVFDLLSGAADVLARLRQVVVKLDRCAPNRTGDAGDEHHRFAERT